MLFRINICIRWDCTILIFVRTVVDVVIYTGGIIFDKSKAGGFLYNISVAIIKWLGANTSKERAAGLIVAPGYVDRFGY